MPHRTDVGREALELEFRLTVGVRNCDCVRYFILRRDVLLPEVMKVAEARYLDPDDLFAAYARGVHARHECGLSLAAAA